MTASPRQMMLPLCMFTLVLMAATLAGWNLWAGGTLAALVAVTLAAIAAMVTASRRATMGEESGDL